MTKSNSTIQNKPKQDKITAREKAAINFIAVSNRKHSNKYSYDKVVYVNSYTKVIITCPEHGDFTQRPNGHSQGSKCPKCSKGHRRKMTTEQFLVRAREKHSQKYSYTKTVYVHSRELVVITCPIHGDFEQAASNHLRGDGCRDCSLSAIAKANTKNTAQFIGKAKKAHSNEYDYSKTKYKGSVELVTITCKEHGDFERTAASHLMGYGCNRCAGVKEPIKITADFVTRAKEVHLNRYDYSQTQYKGRKNKVVIICKEHGAFKQSVSQHLKGSGCPECGKIIGCGYSRKDFTKRCASGLAKLYVIKCFDEKEMFYKVGITSNDLKTRFRNTRSMPYGYATQYEIESNAGYIYDLEVRLHSLLKNKSYEPDIKFRGYTECFTTIKPIEQLLKELSSTKQIQLIA